MFTVEFTSPLEEVIRRYDADVYLRTFSTTQKSAGHARMRHCLIIHWCTQIIILMDFETPTTACGLGSWGTLYKTSSCLPLQSSSDAGLHFLQINMSCQRVASEHPMPGRFGPLPMVRFLCLHNDIRQRSRTLSTNLFSPDCGRSSCGVISLHVKPGGSTKSQS